MKTMEGDSKTSGDGGVWESGLNVTFETSSEFAKREWTLLR
jgi:hypothetical protein